MKSILKKTARVVVAASIPVLLMVSCKSDIIEPDNAMPPKSKMELPPGVKK